MRTAVLWFGRYAFLQFDDFYLVALVDHSLRDEFLAFEVLLGLVLLHCLLGGSHVTVYFAVAFLLFGSKRVGGIFEVYLLKLYAHLFCLSVSRRWVGDCWCFFRLGLRFL